jgi:Bacterial extracellular solute-binding protein
VHAAASLSDAMKEIGAAYEKESGDKVQFNFGASNLLARQIEDSVIALRWESTKRSGIVALGRGARPHPPLSIAFGALVENNSLFDLACGVYDPNFG